MYWNFSGKAKTKTFPVTPFQIGKKCGRQIPKKLRYPPLIPRFSVTRMCAITKTIINLQENNTAQSFPAKIETTKLLSVLNLTGGVHSGYSWLVDVFQSFLLFLLIDSNSAF